jgi:hypothetical protein
MKRLSLIVLSVAALTACGEKAQTLGTKTTPPPTAALKTTSCNQVGQLATKPAGSSTCALVANTAKTTTVAHRKPRGTSCTALSNRCCAQR